MLATMATIPCGLGSLGCAIGPALVGHLIHRSGDSLDFSTTFIVPAGMALLYRLVLLLTFFVAGTTKTVTAKSTEA